MKGKKKGFTVFDLKEDNDSKNSVMFNIIHERITSVCGVSSTTIKRTSIFEHIFRYTDRLHSLVCVTV